MSTLQIETTPRSDGTTTLPIASEFFDESVWANAERDRIELRLKKLIGDELFGSVVSCGDVITPINEAWEAEQ